MKALRMAIACMALVALSAEAEIKLPAIFSDHMVLQRDASIPVWGWAAPGEPIKVTVASVSASGTADKDGKWMVKLASLPMSSRPVTMAVAGKDQTLTVNDVLIGDIWLCSGQSNMQWSLGAASNGREEIAKADHPTIRFFKVPRMVAYEPQTDCKAAWTVCSPQTAAGFSAVGYFFGREIAMGRKVPVGLIGSYVGGTPAQAWTSLGGLDGDPALKTAYGDNLRATAANMTEIKAKHEAWLAAGGAEYLAAVAKWNTANWQALQKGEQPPPRPQPPATPEPPKPDSTGLPTVLYNGMIAPLVPFAIKGVAWYQGESNAGQALYRRLFPVMISDWRRQWGQGDFPFLCVQLPNYRPRATDPNAPSSWALAREAQFLGLKALPKVGMAVTLDIGDGADLHPPFKEEVGKRLAFEAGRIAYGEKRVSCGPLYESFKIEGSAVSITFSSVGAGLKIGVPPAGSKTPAPATGSLKGFAIAGADNKFVWAKASVAGKETVVVSSDEVPNPVAVRYGWGDNPEVNLYNSADLPASPFRTDAPAAN